jgi:hypothetical protein
MFNIKKKGCLDGCPFFVSNKPFRMKYCKLLLFLALFPMFLSAKTLTKQEITTLGTRAFYQKAVQLCPQASEYELKDCEFLESDGAVCLGVLHFEHGFLILSAEDAVMPILAYDFENSIDLEDPAPGVSFFLDYYQQLILEARRVNLAPSEKVQEAWESLLHPSSRGTRAEVVVAPLIRSHWNQNKYYNYLCPKDENAIAGYDGRVPNGCVAIAMSQIMFYYRYPESGTGSHTNYTEYGSFHVNFSQQHYHYEAMCNQLSYHNNEVAKLIFHSGTAVDMMYGPDGSGAYSGDVPGAMSTYFKYNSDAMYAGKHYYSDSVWHSMLKGDLDAGHPLYYSGYSSEGGHAFICDGYDSDEYFHFNFGWGGSGDGYYITDGNDPQLDVVHGYGFGQSAIFNLHPRETNYPTYCQGGMVITAVNGTLEDGSGPYNYLDNTQCTYLITDPNQYSVVISMTDFATQQDHDYLRFWDGIPSDSNLLLELSGTVPSGTNYTFSTDSLYITFETDDSLTDAGWNLSYSCNREGFGCGTHVYNNEYTGTILDNSGENNHYRDNSNCSWVIRIQDVPSITFTFEEMDISPEDHLDFYDMSTYPTTLMGSFSGNTIPAPATYYSNRIKVVFVSDNYLYGEGFKVLWNASGTGIQESNMSGVSLYPNPASDVFCVLFEDEVEDCEITLYDMVGNVQYRQIYEGGGKVDIPVSQLSNGLYVLSLNNGQQTTYKKIVVKH